LLVFGEIEGRWETRLGKDEIILLRKTLQGIEDKLDLELPTPTPLDNQKSRPGKNRIVRAFSTVVKSREVG
jgi:hypothetical protein